MAGHRYRGPDTVLKRLVDEETHTSARHALMAGAGASSIAWGGSRLGSVRRGLRNGARNSALEPSVRRALQIAESTRSTIEHATSPLERITGRGIGRMPVPLRSALEAVPRPLRPATATLAGAILVQHAHPIRRKTYAPVVRY